MQRPQRILSASICLDDSGQTLVKIANSYMPVDRNIVKGALKDTISDLECRIRFFTNIYDKVNR